MKKAWWIILLLAAMAAMLVAGGLAVFSSSSRCRQSSEAVSRMIVRNSLKVPLFAFKVHNDRYPTTEEGLNALQERPHALSDTWQGPYIEELPPDPWNRPYQYRCPGLRNPASYDLFSLGPDGVESADDIGNW